LSKLRSAITFRTLCSLHADALLPVPGSHPSRRTLPSSRRPCTWTRLPLAPVFHCPPASTCFRPRDHPRFLVPLLDVTVPSSLQSFSHGHGFNRLALELRANCYTNEVSRVGRRECIMKLRELSNWPPCPGSPNPNSRNKVPTPDQAVLKSVEPRRRTHWVLFTGEFEGNPHTYDYDAKHAKLADHIETVLRKHIGKSVLHLGDVEIDKDAVTECE
jgi:hypothetical protein